MLKCDLFTREEFELAFAGLLKHRDETGIAGHLEKSPSWVSKMFNPNNHLESALYRAAVIFTAWIRTSPGRGTLALRTFNNFVKRAYPNQDTSPRATMLRLVERVERDCGEIREIASTFELPNETREWAKEQVRKHKEKAA